MKYLEKREGGIFVIPLFLPEGIKENLKNYKTVDFPHGERYAYGRLIEMNDSTGDLVEIFRHIGEIPSSEEIIVASGRLVDPIHTTIAFDRNRWRFVFEPLNYDREIDSRYSEIRFVLGTENDYQLWEGGGKRKISNSEARKYALWTVFNPTRVESAIRTGDLDRLKERLQEAGRTP